MEKKDNITMGILMIVLSALAFAGMHLFVKLLPDLPSSQKIFARNFISLFVALFVIWYRGIIFPKFPKEKKDCGLLLIRCVAGLSGVILNFYAIERLPLAESSLLNRLSPFFVTIFAVIFLKEVLRKVDLYALILVFLFVLLIIRPGFNLNSLAAFAGLLSGVGAGVAYTTLRALKNRVEPSVIIFYFSLFSVITLLGFYGNFVLPTFKEWFALLGLGISASMGQFFITYAYRFAPATEISVYNYTSIVFAIIFDAIIFSVRPNLWSFIGSLGIIIIAVILFIFNKRQGKYVS